MSESEAFIEMERRLLEQNSNDKEALYAELKNESSHGNSRRGRTQFATQVSSGHRPNSSSQTKDTVCKDFANLAKLEINKEMKNLEKSFNKKKIKHVGKIMVGKSNNLPDPSKLDAGILINTSLFEDLKVSPGGDASASLVNATSASKYDQSFRCPSATPNVSKYFTNLNRPRTADISKRVTQKIKDPRRVVSAVIPPKFSTGRLLSARPGSAQKSAFQELEMHQCPLFTRATLQNQNFTFSTSVGRKILNISDVEFDLFVEKVVSKYQFIVIYCYEESSQNSKSEKAKQDLKNLEEYHFQQNKLRSRPCQQSKNDKFRIFKYNLSLNEKNRNVNARARTSGSSQNMGQNLSSVRVSKIGKTPISLRERHNLKPGTFLIYQNGKLLWSGDKFNGYSTNLIDLRIEIRIIFFCFMTFTTLHEFNFS